MPNPVVDRLEQEIAEDTSAKNSAISLLNGLSGELTAIKAELAEINVDNERLNTLVDGLDASTNALAEAVIANTPASE